MYTYFFNNIREMEKYGRMGYILLYITLTQRKHFKINQKIRRDFIEKFWKYKAKGYTLCSL